MRTNLATKPVFNYEGIKASHVSPIEELRRTVLACMLWEDGFYESGEAVADRIKRLIPLCKPNEVEDLAYEAREKQHLRHVPLLLVREMARYPSRYTVAPILERVIQRADEITEFLAIYSAGRTGRKVLNKLPHQVQKGLARAFRKFDAYALAKYNRDNAIKMRDALFLCHAKPKDDEQAALWKQLIDDKLPVPDTWEVALSAGADKKETFERLITEGKLGYMALLRNLRNMATAGVDRDVVAPRLLGGAMKSKALPFRFVAAARAAPAWEPMIDEAMQKALGGLDRLPGKTAVLIDVSPSMNVKLSSKSELTRTDAACALAVLLRGVCEDVRVFSFSNEIAEVPPRAGMALFDAIKRAVPSNGTRLGAAVSHVAKVAPGVDRLIVFTDEESQDAVPKPHCRGTIVNVSHSKNGVGYGDWTHINGFSEAVVQYIQASEAIKP